MASVGIKVDKLYCEGNVRTPECTAIPAMVESFQRNGYKENHPLVVSQKDDDRYLVLVGNRRTTALFFLRDNYPDDFKSITTNGKVPCIVHKGLTAEEEVLIRIDHSKDEDRVPLDEWSIFLAIKQLTQTGLLTQEQTAEKLGYFHTKGKSAGKPNRSYVQIRVNLARLPQFVQDEMRKGTLDRDSTPLRMSDVAKLSKAYNAEYVEYPAADGPLFQAAWKAALTPPEKSTDTTNALTAKDAVKRSQAASSVGLAKALMIVTGQSADSIVEVDQAILQGESALVLLDKIRVYMGDADYALLVKDCQSVTEYQEA